jgi:hypothetical protein
MMGGYVESFFYGSKPQPPFSLHTLEISNFFKCQKSHKLKIHALENCAIFQTFSYVIFQTFSAWKTPILSSRQQKPIIYI